ncbi:MAG: hypothetical protein AAFU64_00835 [Bacteroidota bacterium]
MKLRMTKNSIRIRIRKSELALLKENQKISESVQFPGAPAFQFSLAIVKQEDKLKARLENQHLGLFLSPSAAEYWFAPSQVSLESFIDLPEGEQLHLLLEKDFPCLDRPEQDKSDTFWELAPENPESC